LERYQCPACDLVFGPLKMLDITPQMLAADYQLLYESYREANSTVSEVRAFHSLAPTKMGIYLNWGCGAWSETIEQLRGQEWDVWGYEPSVPPESAFVAGHTDQISATFDGIFSNNVIEHFRDPVGEFREMASHLRPGGLMTHATGCYRMNFADTRFHTAFYLGRSVEVLADEVGLEVVARDADGDYESVTFRVRAG
jgi:SAM-dependent methyltransferase